MESKREIKFNKPQMSFILALNKIKDQSTMIWGRATGKSFIIAWLMHKIITTMPRASWFIAGQTFKQLLGVTLPGTLSALELLGYRRNIHYFIGEPPKSWILPYGAPTQAKYFENYITFLVPGDKDKRSVGFHLVSLDKAATSFRGQNTDGGIVDERLLIDPDKFRQEINATNRGNLKQFEHVNFHHAVFDFSSMPVTSQGNYLLDRSNYYDLENFEFTQIRNRQIDLQLEFLKTIDIKYRKELFKEWKALSLKLEWYVGSKGQFYSESNVFDNIENVGLKYIEQQYSEMTELMFLIEMLNKRLKKIEGGYYPTFDREIHAYKGHWDYSFLDSLNYNFDYHKKPDCRQDADLYKNSPICISMDFGAKINCLIAFQHITTINQVNFLKNFYAKHPKLVDDVAEEFCEYYRFHNHKVVYFWHDPAGNARRGDSTLTMAARVQKILVKNGFTVILKSRDGHNRRHNSKYYLMGRIFAEDQYPRFPRYRFNLYNCKELIISLEQSRILEKDGEIKKDKRDERKDNIDQSETTHFSDALDIPSWDLFQHAVNSTVSSIPVLVK